MQLVAAGHGANLVMRNAALRVPITQVAPVMRCAVFMRAVEDRHDAAFQAAHACNLLIAGES